jgi:hypothetical protein
MHVRLLAAVATCAGIASFGATVSHGALSPQKVAWKRFSAWALSVAVYKEDQHTYVGMTKAKLATWDYGILAYPVRIGWGTKTHYCLATTVSGHVFHRVGPMSPFTSSPKIAAPAGNCPAP